MKTFKKFLLTTFILIPFGLFAQDTDVEEVVVVGSQIKGASITDALPVTVLSADDIEALGVSDGDELVENLVEQGLNFFNEQEQASGGVNASRGDSGAYNLRSMGVGNTLTLLNGRRMVNNAGYQTEYIGGDFVPTVTVNTNLIPTNGLDRLEILRDGASAIYGADAVAGVVNNVLKTDYEGSSLSVRVIGYEHFDATDTDISYKAGTDFNNGATNMSVFARFRDRENIVACEDERWCEQNYERYLPEDSPYFGAGLDNTSAYAWWQLDFSKGYNGAESYLASDGETLIAPIDSIYCQQAGAVPTGMGTCLFDESAPLDFRSNQRGMEGEADFRSEMQRSQIFLFTNHEFDNGIELFNELGYYKSSTSRNISAGSWKSGMWKLPSEYYWTQKLPQNIGFATNDIALDGWRPFNKGRTIDVDKTSTRFVLGFRGTLSSGWDWETAIVKSKASSNDLAKNRMGYPQLYESLGANGSLLETPQAFNIYDTNWETNNGEQLLIDVRRDDKSTLDMFDIKMSNPEVFNVPAGPVAVLVGYEQRKETYTDDRDPLLDGTITTTDCCGVTSQTRSHPFTSAVMGSSPTVDVFGVKRVTSGFVEFLVPITDKLDTQIAFRKENFSDTESTGVGRIAFGYTVNDVLKFRGSFSTAFRSPNILQINQPFVTRTGTRDDAVQKYRLYKNNNNVVPASGTGSNDWTILNTLHFRLGNPDLEPEESDNATFGVVVTPIDELTITVDRWSIEKENTIGLFGRTNHSVLDLLLRIEQGIGNVNNDPNYTVAQMLNFCAGKNILNNQFGKYAIAGSDVYRDADYTTLDDQFLAAGICPAGQQDVIYEPYRNLATRTVEGTDLSVYYSFETSIGDFNITLQSSITDKFEQEPSAEFARIEAAVDAGVLPAYTTISGYGDLLGLESTGTDRKDTLKVNYRRGDWGASLTALRLGELLDTGVKTSDGIPWKIPSMTTANLSVYKKFTLNGNDARLRFMVKNIADERAPLADGFFGFYSDIHRDEGRNFYLDLRMDF